MPRGPQKPRKTRDSEIGTRTPPPPPKRRRLQDEHDQECASAAVSDGHGMDRAGDGGGGVKESSVEFSEAAPANEWTARESEVRKLFEEHGSALEGMTMSKLVDVFRCMKPLCKFAGRRGGKSQRGENSKRCGNSQRAVYCLFLGFPERFALDYKNSTKSTIGSVCFHASIVRFRTLGEQFIMISRLDENELPEYLCVPLSDNADFEVLRSGDHHGFRTDATQAIKSAFNAYKTSKGIGGDNPPQKNEICINSYPTFVRKVFETCRDLSVIGKRINEERKRRPNLPSEVINEILSLVPPGLDLTTSMLQSCTSESHTIMSSAIRNTAPISHPNQDSARSPINSLALEHTHGIDLLTRSSSSMLHPFGGQYYPLPYDADWFRRHESSSTLPIVQPLFQDQASCSGTSGSREMLEVQSASAKACEDILMETLDWLASGLPDDKSYNGIMVFHQLTDEVLGGFDDCGFWSDYT